MTVPVKRASQVWTWPNKNICPIKVLLHKGQIILLQKCCLWQNVSSPQSIQLETFKRLRGYRTQRKKPATKTEHVRETE